MTAPPPRPAAPSGRTSTLVAAGILASRVAGVLREVVIAAFLGTTPARDAFAVAMRVPNFLQNLLGEGVLSASFIPAYSRLLAEGRRREAARLASTVATLLVAVTTVLVALGVLAAGPLTDLLAPGLEGDRRTLTTTLIRITFPGIGLLVLSAWCLGILNSHRRFFLSYVAPVLWNAAQIVVVVVAATLVHTATTDADSEGLAVALAWGTVLGGVLQVAVQLPRVRRLEPGVRPGVRMDALARRVVRAVGPVVGARGVVQVSAFVDTALASLLVTGALSVLYYAQVLYLLPISLFGMSVAAAELPELSAAPDRAAGLLRSRLDQGLRRIAWFVVPTAAAYLVAGDLLLGALLQRGAFDRTASVQVWLVLAGYAVGLLAATQSRLLQSALYAVGDTTTPARSSVVRVVVAVVVGVVLMFQLDRVAVAPGGLEVVGTLPAFGRVPAAEATGARLGALGLTLGSGIAAWVEYRLLRVAVSRRVGRVRPAGGALEPIAIATGLAVLATLVLRLLLGWLPVAVQAVVVLAAAGVIYLAVTTRQRVPLVRVLRGR